MIVGVLYDKWQEGGNKGGVRAVRTCPNCGEKRVLFRRTPNGVVDVYAAIWQTE